MKERFKLFTLATLLTISASNVQAKDYIVKSPDGKLTATISDGGKISVTRQGKDVVSVQTDLTIQNFPPGKVGVSSG